MNTIKALIEFFTYLSKGTQLIIIGLMGMGFLTTFVEIDSYKLYIAFGFGVLITLIGQVIDYFYPRKPSVNPPAAKDCNAHVIIRKDTGIIVDSYIGGPLDANQVYLREAMRDGEFKHYYSIVSFSNKSKFTMRELKSLVGEHADIAFSESVKHTGFNADWARHTGQ
jgi:hypothetical protein